MHPASPAYSHRGLDVLKALAGRKALRLDTAAFYFLRHGETEGNRTRRVQPADIPLNETGRAQAERAARILAGQPIQRIQRILASDMARAWTTAGIVAGSLDLPVASEPRLRERWFGDHVGRSSLDLDWAADPPNGETLGGFIDRVCDGAAAALAHPERTLLVSHGGVLHVLLAALGIATRPEHIANAAPLLFEREGGAWRVTPLMPDAGPVPAGSLS